MKNSQINYQKQLDSLLSSFSANSKKKLLLHACCGPCSSYVIEYLSNFFDITVLFYNPNIYPEKEYYRRLDELKNFYIRFPPVIQNQIKLIEIPFNPEEFFSYIDIINHPNLAHEPEKGERCKKCYELRLQKTYEYALLHNFDYFCTTLSISPFKDAEKINEIGLFLQNNGDSLPSPKQNKDNGDSPRWLISDFKKKNGFKRSLEISEEYSLYRQEYCGCIYSLKNKK